MDYTLEHTNEKLINVHDEGLCVAEKCPIHNKSEHALRQYPQEWFINRMWRNQYGTLIPDPDDVLSWYGDMRKTFEVRLLTEIVSNTAQCKLCGDVITSHYRHDLATCSCGGIFVDGGNSYLRRGGRPELLEEKSIVRKRYCMVGERIGH